MSESSVTNENTPLLPKPKYHSPKRKSFHIYASTLGSLLLFSFLIHWYRTILPTPLSDAQAKQVDGFAGIHAYNEYLSHFNAPHSANSRQNGHMRDWISSIAEDLQGEAAQKGLTMDVISKDPSTLAFRQDWFKEQEYWFVDSRNVIVRLHGQSEKEDALLVNAHYDSVPSSFGVTDNGMGVCTALELLRYFVHHPPRQTIIFLFNNMEEGGLVGARTFVNHPWYKSIKLFVNLEGGGAGGRAMLFRGSSLDAVKKAASSGASYVHGSPLGNDMFKAGLIKSDTDYTVFTENGVPGLDVAFYGPRSHYHTARDDLAHTTPEALQYMGQYALGTIRAIANSDELLDTPKEDQSFVFYDILGRFMFAYSFTVYQVINILALLVVPSTAGFIFLYRNRDAHNKYALFKEFDRELYYGILAVLNALLFSIVFTLVAVFIMGHVKPSVSYGNAYFMMLYIVSAIFLGLQVSQWVLPKKMKDVLATTDASWYGLIGFWYIFVVISVVAGTKKVGGLYFAVYLLLFTSTAALVNDLVPKNKKFRSPIIFYTQILVPFVLLLEIGFIGLDSIRHSTPDGTPEMAVYILLAFPLILIMLNFVPWIYVVNNTRQVTKASGYVFVLMFIVCCVLSPFNKDWSPNKLVFTQAYNVTSGLSTVSIFTYTGLKSILKTALPANEFNTLSCVPFRDSLTSCNYETKLVPIYAGNASLHEFYHSQVVSDCDDTQCVSSFEFSAKNSLMCRIDFDLSAAENARIQEVWVGDKHQSGNVSSVVTYVDQYEQLVKVKLVYPTKEQHDATLSCYYDEWVDHQIPAFTALRDNLPADVVMAIRGQGISIAHYDTINL
ncbi:hypothetical protein K501DRAFT_239409 [Backusella circina FSU 941]|nr:hypothetical protein K501DRAFT_239409 [Backusella circina FSU 941]